ncbi:hypothetical protein FJT64_017876 [Amphibalanus amphitrite]|nr:hypothetical protein FJT64_009010 [Amphibalanus amphitrite]KAF0311320.1 hypothetical protein FJT64_017876 [Amphibalanus amphitrite]
MASDYQRYSVAYRRFVQPTAGRDKSSAPIAGCGCPRPCAQDRYSYSPLADVTVITNDTFRMAITVRRVRRTMVTVLTYQVEDLLADTGGYLGLLLGFSVLSLFGTADRLTRRLVRSARRGAAARRAARIPLVRALSRATGAEEHDAPTMTDDGLSSGQFPAVDHGRQRLSVTEW